MKYNWTKETEVIHGFVCLFIFTPQNAFQISIELESFKMNFCPTPNLFIFLNISLPFQK